MSLGLPRALLRSADVCPTAFIPAYTVARYVLRCSLTLSSTPKDIVCLSRHRHMFTFDFVVNYIAEHVSKVSWSKSIG